MYLAHSHLRQFYNSKFLNYSSTTTWLTEWHHGYNALELDQRWGLCHKGKIKSKSVYSKNFWTPAQIAEASKVILSPCQPGFHSSALTPSSLKQELNKPGLKASSQPIWKLWTFLCTEELVLQQIWQQTQYWYNRRDCWATYFAFMVEFEKSCLISFPSTLNN